MRNRLPQFPGRVHLAPVEGQANVFDLTRADGATDPGTPINKATMLSDDTEALIWGAVGDRTPNDAFGKMSELYQHWWSVLHGEAYSYYEGVKTPITASYDLFYQSASLSYSKNIDIDDTGTITLSNPVTLTVTKSNLDSVKAAVNELVSAAPVYIECNSPGSGALEVRYIPAGATGITYTASNTNQPAGTTESIVAVYDKNDDESVIRQNSDAPEEIRICNLTTRRIDVPAGETTYVNSADRNAYPDSGTVDGLTYTYLGVPFENARTAPKIEMGSYVGTGKYDSANPNSLTFGFKPKFVFIRACSNDTAMGGGYSSWVAIFPVHELSENYNERLGWAYIGENAPSTYSNRRFAKIVGTTLTWYTTKNSYGDSEQLNDDGYTYSYVAIG